MSSHPEVITFLAGFLLLLGSVSLIALLFMAAAESLSEEAAAILAILAVIGEGVAVFLLPAARFGLGIFCLAIAAFAGLILSIKAMMNAVEALSGPVLLSLFMLCGVAGYFLITQS